MLDLFCGRLGWSKAFLARGWEVVAVDLVRPPDLPASMMLDFVQQDVMELTSAWVRTEQFDFICASSPCEQFSVHGMKHFHPNPPYPELGIKLFNHTREICEASGLPYVMENVRAAQQFVGQAVHHCGPFYLWGSGVPAVLPAGIRKGINTGGSIAATGATREEITAYRRKHDPMWSNSKSEKRKQATAERATIPPELSSCVADYAEALILQTTGGCEFRPARD